MKRTISIIILCSLFSSFGQAANLRGFLKACAWGTVGGAAAGVVSLAFADKPNESWNNVAKGASLGLYAGIAYGVLEANRPEVTTIQAPEYTVTPQFNKGAIEGIQFSSLVYRF